MNKNYLSFLAAFFLIFKISAQISIGGVVVGKNFSVNALPTSCGTLFSFQTTDTNPSGLAFDGTVFYSGGGDADLIYKYNLTGQMVGTIPHPGGDESGGDMDFDGTNLWVVSEQQGKIYKINPANGVVLSQFPLPSSPENDPNNFGCAYENGYVWTTEYFDQALVKMDATTGEIVSSFPTAHRILPLKIINGELYGVAYLNGSPTGPMQLEKLDKTNGSILESYPLCIPYIVGLAFADSHIWSLSGFQSLGTQSINKFDPALLSNNKFSVNHPISVYPNPAIDFITVNTVGIVNHIALYDNLGKKVRTVGNPDSISTDINLSGLQNGIYFVKISVDGNIYTEKILKK